MKVCIIGCGAIGGLYGAHLARLDDVEVWAFDLAREHVDAINRNGLRLTGLSDFVVHRTCPDQGRGNPRMRVRYYCDKNHVHPFGH